MYFVIDHVPVAVVLIGLFMVTSIKFYSFMSSKIDLNNRTEKWEMGSFT